MTTQKFVDGFTILVSNAVAATGTFAGSMWVLGTVGENKLDTVVRIVISGLVTFYTMKELVENQLRK